VRAPLPALKNCDTLATLPALQNRDTFVRYWADIQVGSEHSCGVREFLTAQSASVREMLCWGGNSHGQTNVPVGNLTLQACPPEFSVTPQQVLQRSYKYWNFGYPSDQN